MKRYVTTADVVAITLPALAAVVGTWHLVYNHDGNSLGQTTMWVGVIYALYVGGYLLWGAVARAIGAASVIALLLPMLVLGYVTLIAFYVLPLAVPNAAGLLAALAWASRRRDAASSVPAPVRRPATSGDAIAIVLPTILMMSTIIAYANTGVVPAVALRPWVVGAEYVAYLGGFGFWRLQQGRAARRIVVPCALIAIMSATLGSTSIAGVLVLIFVGMPAAGAAVAGLLAELSPDGDSPSHARRGVA